MTGGLGVLGGFQNGVLVPLLGLMIEILPDPVYIQIYVYICIPTDVNWDIRYEILDIRH